MKLATLASLMLLLINTSALAQSNADSAAATPAAPTSDQAASAARDTPPAGASSADHELQTVTAGLRSGPMQLTGWFVAPTFTSSRFAGSLAYSPGIRAGVFLNRKLSVGLAAHAIGNDDSYFEGEPVRNVGTYGGLLLQYAVQPHRLLHATIESTLGSGRWCVEISEERDGCMGRNFLVFEPAANVELNVAKHVRIAAGVGYRFAAAGSGPGPDSGGMSSLIARTSLIFGSF